MLSDDSVLDLFSGCGGFSLGAHLAGFDVGLAVDVDPIHPASPQISRKQNTPGLTCLRWILLTS